MLQVSRFSSSCTVGINGYGDCLGQAQISSDEREAEDLRVPWFGFHGMARWTKFGKAIGKAIDTFEYKLFTLTGPGHSSFSTPSSTAKRMISRFTSAFTSICLHLSHIIIIYYHLLPFKARRQHGFQRDTMGHHGTPARLSNRFGGSCPSTRSACTAKGAAGDTRGHQGSLQLSHVTARHSTSQHRLKEEGNVLFKLPDSERHRETA